MEPVIVWGDRVKLTAADVLPDGAKLEIAEKRYISPLYRVTFGPLSQVAAYYFNFLSVLHGWHPNEAEALTLYRQDERLKMLGALDSLAELETIGGDSKDAKDFQRIRFEAAAASRYDHTRSGNCVAAFSFRDGSQTGTAKKRLWGLHPE